MLLNEYWDESYWPSCGRLRECTRVGYASAWRRHIRPELGDMDLADLTGPRIQSWLDSITSAGAARKAWDIEWFINSWCNYYGNQCMALIA